MLFCGIIDVYVAEQLIASFYGIVLLQRASLFEQLNHLIVLIREAHCDYQISVLLIL